MNNACPSCGAVYAVTAKDIGRKLKCKKCSSALIVTDAGLVMDAPAPAAVVAATEDDFDTGDEVVTPRSKKGKKAARDYDAGSGGPSFVEKIGGIPTILFSLGVFLVIWFTFMSKIGDAAIQRADAAVDKLKLEEFNKIKALAPKGKEDGSNWTEEERKSVMDGTTKIHADYVKRMAEAEEDATSTRIGNIRSLWWDRYGQMFGFLFVAFGCIGFLRTEGPPLVMRIVAAVILGFMMIIVFSSFGGCGGDSVPKLPNVPKMGKGGGG